MKWLFSKRLRDCLMACFVILALFPLVFNIMISFLSDRQQITTHRDALAEMKTTQMAQKVDLAISDFEDVLYQLCTDDELSRLAKNLNHGEDAALTRNQIRRKLQGVFWLKDYIVSLTTISESGEIAFYDSLSSSLQSNACLDALTQSRTELFETISSTNRVTVFPTRYVTHFAGEDHYLFYLGYRIINEKAITRTDAVILMAVNAKVFEQFLTDEQLAQTYTFLLDKDQRIIWCRDAIKIGQQVPDVDSFLKKDLNITSPELKTYSSAISKTEWTLISALDCVPFTLSIDKQLLRTMIITVISFFLVFWVVLKLTNYLSDSVYHISQTMQDFSHGNLDARVQLPEIINPEIRIIAIGLNSMAGQIQNLMQAEQAANEKIKNAEIAALEAQMNPHFIYNTLDTISWMAIEQEQYPIANMISAFGKTLRYGIDNSNGIVCMEEEINWLKQHLYIHQNRLTGKFRCELNISPEVLPCRVHKLLLQPFVENAMIHGFAQNQADCLLQVTMLIRDNRMYIEIADNGCGIPEEILSSLTTSSASIQQKKRYHGMQNAINRLKLYYGDDAEVNVRSSPGVGTQVEIIIPVQIEEGLQ